MRLTSARPRLFGVIVALVALGLAACGHHNSSTPTTKPTATPTPVATGSAAPGCTNYETGIAYLPDGGNGGAFEGVQVVHFETIGGTLCDVGLVQAVPFAGPVGPFWISADASVSFAAIGTAPGNGPFTQLQDVFYAGNGLIPIGNTYDVTQPPTPAPSVSPTAYPSVLPVLSDVASLASIGSSGAAVGVVGGVGNGILAINNLRFPPPQFGGFAPYQGATPGPGFLPRPSIAISAQTPPTTVLVRGPYDILSYNTTVVATGYQFRQVSQNMSLGYGAGRLLRGNGGMAISGSNSSIGIVIQAPSLNDVTAVSTLPSTFNVGSIVQLPSTPHSVAIASDGTIAVVGADNGVYVFTGVNSAALKLVTPFAPNPYDRQANAPKFIGCDGNLHYMTNVTSVAISLDQHYLVILGTAGQNCSNGLNSSLVALPFDTITGGQPTPSPTPTARASPSPTPSPNPSPTASPSPVPTMFTANGLVTQPSDTDYLIVH